MVFKKRVGFFVALIFMAALSGITADHQPIDYKIKRQRSIKLMNKARNFFEQHSLGISSMAFAHSNTWRDGSITLHLFDIDGVRIVDRVQPNMIWERVRMNDIAGEPLAASMRKASSTQGEDGWVHYDLFNSVYHLCVTSVKKNKKTYILGAGFFDDAPASLCELLVDTIAKTWEKFDNIHDLFAAVDNPVGQYSKGSHSAIIIDFKGLCLAHGSDSLLIGQNLLDARFDPRGEVRKVVDFFKNHPKEKILWIDSSLRGLRGELLAKIVVDRRTGKRYIVMSYYWNISKKTVVECARDTIISLKKYDKKEALEHINRPAASDNPWAHANVLKIGLIDMDGIALAYSNAQNTSHIGRSLLGLVDQQGRPVIKFLLEVVRRDGKGWTALFGRNELEHIYGEKVTTSWGDVIVLVLGYYPSNKYEIAPMLVADVQSYARNNSYKTVVAAFFKNPPEPFIKGDVQAALFTSDGICLVDGLRRELSWSDDKMLASAPNGWINDQRVKDGFKKSYVSRDNTLQGVPGTYTIVASFYDDRR